MRDKTTIILLGLLLCQTAILAQEIIPDSTKTTAYLVDKNQENYYLQVKDGEIVHTPLRANASHFILENITQAMSQKYGIGNAHYLIKFDGKLLNTDGKKLTLGLYNNHLSHWSSVIHYQFWRILKNNNYELEQVEP
ncbi:TPA: hypothetical protein DCW54_03570 [Candidatus Dependentiae bacterium]|nr:hypothetical protein [Candidatus Dependentiae bacterium]